LTKGSVTRELVLVRDPDYLFIVTMGLVSQEELKIWNQYKNLKAVRNKHVFLLDPEKACTPTPVNFVDTVEEMIRLMWR
jgi:iron complex transport system substrate-binding protein